MKVHGAVKPFIKRHDVNTASDWSRVTMFSALIARVDGLATATPLWKDESSGVIAYERLPALRPLLHEHTKESTFRRFGLLLARLHMLGLPASATSGPISTYPMSGFKLEPPELRLLERLPIGFFWGDCWHGNVFVHDDGRFYVIDPLPHRWLFDNQHLLANGAMDLAMLHMSLFFSHRLTKLMWFDPGELMPHAKRLLEGYLTEVGALPALPVLNRLSRILATRYIAAYRHRLVWPIAIGKQKLSARVMSKLDERVDEVI